MSSHSVLKSKLKDFRDDYCSQQRELKRYQIKGGLHVHISFRHLSNNLLKQKEIFSEFEISVSSGGEWNLPGRCPYTKGSQHDLSNLVWVLLCLSAISKDSLAM